jgi:RimJ/RimL family protein N-acetyltransferase
MKPWEPLLFDFPHSFETERLFIRLPMPGDGEMVYEAILESLDALRKWMPWAKKPPTMEETEANVRRAYLQFLERSDLRFHIFEKSSGVFIGSSGLHQIEWSVPRFEIGYWCRSKYTGRGYITEAVRGLTVFAFKMLKAKRIEIRCDERNLRSRKVAERLGYRLEGVLRHYRLAVDHTLENTCIYAMTTEDFRLQSMREKNQLLAEKEEER